MNVAALRVCTLAAVVAVSVALPGCHEQAPTGAPTTATPTTSAALPATTATATAAASAAATGSASAAAQGANALAGTWTGTYEAKKGEIVQPEGVKDKHWKKDEGKTHVGAGTVTLTIGADGAVQGAAKGALGEQVIEGNTDGKLIGLRVRPKEPLAPDGFTGTLVALVKGNTLEGELKCAGPTADVIRHAPIKLEKK